MGQGGEWKEERKVKEKKLKHWHQNSTIKTGFVRSHNTPPRVKVRMAREIDLDQNDSRGGGGHRKGRANRMQNEGLGEGKVVRGMKGRSRLGGEGIPGAELDLSYDLTSEANWRPKKEKKTLK